MPVKREAPTKAQHLIALAVLVLLTPGGSFGQAPLGAACTYQGQLDSGGVPVNGSFDLRFTL